MAEQQMTEIQRLSNTVATVQKQIDTYVKEGKLDLPPNYSAGNALKLAQLKIQDDDKLMNCTQASIAKSLLDMTILGLNISKQQVYLIPYNGQMQISISYMGKESIAKRINPNIKDIFGRVVKKGETFKFHDNVDGTTTIEEHTRTLESMDSKDIIAAYCTITYKDGSPATSTIMTFDRIKRSWMQSQMRPVDANGNIKEGSVHAKFTEDMCVKSVISAACKSIINTSNDKDLFNITVQSVDLDEAKTYADAEAHAKMSTGEFIDVEFEDERKEPELNNIDKETGEIFE